MVSEKLTQLYCWNTLTFAFLNVSSYVNTNCTYTKSKLHSYRNGNFYVSLVDLVESYCKYF